MNGLNQGFSGLTKIGRCTAACSGGLAVANASWSPIVYNVGGVDDYNIHDPVGAPFNFYDPMTPTHFRIIARVTWNTRPVCSQLNMALYHNVDGVIHEAINHRDNTSGSIAHDVDMLISSPIIPFGSRNASYSHYVQLYQNSGGSLSLSAAVDAYIEFEYYKQY